jgi:hypothetical protein
MAATRVKLFVYYMRNTIFRKKQMKTTTVTCTRIAVTSLSVKNNLECKWKIWNTIYLIVSEDSFIILKSFLSCLSSNN